MPQMGGLELVEKLSETRPDLKVVYMSGYTEAAALHQGVLPEGAVFIQKPFTPRALAAKVSEALQGRAVAALAQP